jgi:MFS family permease
MTRDLRILAFSLLLWGLGEGLFIYFQPLYLDELGADPIQIGSILGFSALALTLSHLPAGALADIIGRKAVMVAAWFAGAIATLTMFLAKSLPLFVVGLVLYSFSGFVLSPMYSYIADARGSWSLTRALTTTSAFFSFGTILGPIVGGQLAEVFGLRTIYGIASAIFIPSTLLILFVRPQPVETLDDGSRYQDLIKNKNLGGFLVLVFIGMFAMYLSWPLTPIFLQEVRQVSVGSVGIFGSLNALGMVILNLTLGRMSPYLGFTIAQVATGFSVLFLWRGTGQAWFSLGYFLAAGFRIARSFVTAQVELLVKRTEIGLAFGLAETVGGSVMLIASSIAGILYDINPESPFSISLILIAVSLTLTLLIGPRFRTTHVKPQFLEESNVPEEGVR